MRLLNVLVVTLVLAGCGRTEAIPPVRPFSASMSIEDGGVYCRSACPGLPPGVLTPLQQVQGGVILHWPACEGCLQLTVDRRFNNDTVKAEGNFWDITLGGGLCLEAAVPADDMPENARQRIHVKPNPQGTAVVQRFEVDTGIIRNAEISIAGSVNRTELSFLLGRALGLDKSMDQLNSIMSFPNTQRTTPGMNDQASLRALYGPPSLWCTD